MTKKGFKEAMMRGLGRCILELDHTENVEKYRETVLWGCTHNISYDTQCEVRGECISQAVSLLANHYRKEDREVLVRLVKSISVTFDDKEGWHGAYSSVLDPLETKGVKSAPKELLPYLYEHTLCSCCREYIVKEMGRRHMVTEELLRECLYDSNYEIRKYAEKRLGSRGRYKYSVI